MAENLDTFPGFDDCVFCYGKVRVATRREIAECLRTTEPRLRAALEAQDGTWYICPRCGIESAVKWGSIASGE